MLRAPVPCFRINAMYRRRVAALIVRSVPAFSHKCHHTARRLTRCCDAQGAVP